MGLEMFEELVRGHRHSRRRRILVADDEEKDESDEQLNWIREKEMSEPDDSDPQWSIEGSPPVAEDARREQPADPVQQQRGACSAAIPLLPEAAPWVSMDFL